MVLAYAVREAWNWLILVVWLQETDEVDCAKVVEVRIRENRKIIMLLNIFLLKKILILQSSVTNVFFFG